MDDSTHSRLDQLSLSIAAGLWGEANCWRGADVVILANRPDSRSNGFYPEQQTLITTFPDQLSWLFERLRDVALRLDGYGAWKEEFFGRLAVRAGTVPTTAPLKDLLFATLREAYELLGMHEIGMTMHDWTSVIIHPRHIGEDIKPFDKEAIRLFFDLRGIAID